VEEVVKSIGASDEFDGVGVREEESFLLLLFSDWTAGCEENCRLTKAWR
jgi:hypothetical protein